jgi:hypothetical protein
MSATLREAVAAHFRAHPNQWVSAYTLMEVGGRMAWRTRVSDVRRMGLTIENQVQRDGAGVAQSFYRYVPPVALKQAGLFTEVA